MIGQSSSRMGRLLYLLVLLVGINLQEERGSSCVSAFALSPLLPSIHIASPRTRGSQHFFATVEDESSSLVGGGSSSPKTKPSIRRVATVEKFARLPVWPVWMGVIVFLVGKTLGNESAAKLEDALGGRVCPNFFPDTEATSPFIMLVHHRHSFSALDPIRWFQNKFILPEGFPSHSHRGFTTLTYFLKGGFRHRDSLGIAQDYGRPTSTGGDNQNKRKNVQHHSQWLFTGAGLLHEEMFDQSPQQELFQLWVNVPSYRKLDAPTVDLLGDAECPRVVLSDETETIVLAGTYQGQAAKTPVMSEMGIFHVFMQQGSTWRYTVPASFETVILYMRQGSCTIDNTDIPVHHTAYLERIGDSLVVSSSHGADFLLLTGQPLREPVAAQGSMVMNTNDEINQAYRDYQRGLMGMPWSHEMSDEEWKTHISQYPSRYKYLESSSSSSERV